MEGIHVLKDLLQAGRLHDESESEGRLLHGANPQLGQIFPQVQSRKHNVQFELSAVGFGMRAVGFNENPKTSGSTVETTGGEANSLYRRHPHYGRKSTQSLRSWACPNILPGKPGVYSQSQKKPTQVVDFLRFMVNSAELELRLPSEKIRRSGQIAQQVLAAL